MSKRIRNRLREYRLKAGLRQVDVAERLGFKSTERISRWEKGQAYPHMVNLFKLGRLYSVEPQALYPLTEPAPDISV